MTFPFDNQTLLYVIIAFFVVQIFITRYYVNTSIEDNNRINNKKIIKKISGQVSTTFDQYMGNRLKSNPDVHQEKPHHDRNQHANHKRPYDMDSIVDPAENVDDDAYH